MLSYSSRTIWTSLILHILKCRMGNCGEIRATPWRKGIREPLWCLQKTSTLWEKNSGRKERANFSRLNFAVHLEKRGLLERVLAPLPGITDLRGFWRSVARQAGVSGRWWCFGCWHFSRHPAGTSLSAHPSLAPQHILASSWLHSLQQSCHTQAWSSLLSLCMSHSWCS